MNESFLEVVESLPGFAGVYDPAEPPPRPTVWGSLDDPRPVLFQGSDPEDYEFREAAEAVDVAFGDRFDDETLGAVAEHLAAYATYEIDEYDEAGNPANTYMSFAVTPEDALREMRQHRRKLVLHFANMRTAPRMVTKACAQRRPSTRQPRPKRTRRSGSRARSPGRLGDDPDEPSDIAFAAAGAAA